MMQAAAQENWTDFSDEIVELELNLIEDSPFNTRVLREDDKMRELADSIRAHGVLVPIIYREVEVEGDVVKFELIAGHRRLFGSKLAGRTTIPAIHRDLSDDEARELQITENLLREDLPPLEEARAFNEAMTLHGAKMLSVQELAARLGKSPVYINRRLTLLDAIAPVQEALSNGFIEVGHALELARLDDGEQQRLIFWLGVVAEKDEDDDGDSDGEDEEDEDEDEDESPFVSSGLITTKSVVDLRSFIARTTLHVLGPAPFDPHDASLDPEAGSCADCLKRTGASPLLFSDVRAEDVCSDPSCYDGKVKLYVAKWLEDARANKTPRHRLTTNYGGKGADLHYVYNGLREAKDNPCAATVEAIYIDGSERGKIIPICIGDACKVHGRGSSSRGASAADPKAKEQRKALLAKVKVEKDYRLALFKELMSMQMPDVPSELMVKSLVAFALGKVDSTKHGILTETLGWHKDTLGWQEKSKGPLAVLTPVSDGEAVRIALVALEAHELTVHEYDIDRKNNAGKKPEIGLERVARLIGLDAAKVRARFKPDTPKPAAKKAAAKSAAKKAPAKKPTKKRKAS